MTVYPIKSKCITFSTKNKRNEKDIFHIGTAPLENVTEYTYLGLKVNAAGSFLLSKTFLSDKANRAKYALNNIAKFKHLPVKTAIRLFDAAVLPILTYGAEVWALNLTLDNDKWDQTTTEGVHLNFIKHILGVNRSANNNLCRAELGRYPISIDINYKIINFFRHMQNMAKDTVIHQTLITDNSQKHLGLLGTLSQNLIQK